MPGVTLAMMEKVGLVIWITHVHHHSSWIASFL
jgi:hypothetical protein